MGPGDVVAGATIGAGRHRSGSPWPLVAGVPNTASESADDRRVAPVAKPPSRFGLMLLEQPVDGFEIAPPAVTDDLVPGRRRGDGLPAPRLAGGDVADVDLDSRALAGDERVVQRVAGVRQRAEVAD